MKRAIIFANGTMEQPPAIPGGIQPGMLLIAADGGSRHCKTLGLIPSVIIGDFDSLGAEELSQYRERGVEILQHPREKDQTDLELAVRLAIERGMREVYITGALGKRLDMTIANLLLLAMADFAGVKFHVLDGRQEILILRGRGAITLEGLPGDSLSLIPLSGDATGITTHGLKYPMKDEALNFGSSRGVSNLFSDENARIALKQGILLCVFNPGSEP